MSADWQLPAGVSRALWDHVHDTEAAGDYDRTLAGTPLLQIDVGFVREHCRPAGKIIDLGCGTGRLALALAQAGYAPVGVDLSPPMLQILRGKADQLGLYIPCVCGNIVELGFFADQSFDHAACLFSTFGLVVGADARRRVLAHVRRLLKPGGVFVLHVHNRWFNFWTRAGRRLLFREVMSAWSGRGAAGDYAMPAYRGTGTLTMHLFTRSEIVGLLRSAGFSILEVRPVSVAGLLTNPGWFGSLRCYGYLIAAQKL